tara:strand:- start:138 stop:473 length:336 start_codon:yes stop_codon:yes gene_type:complete
MIWPPVKAWTSKVSVDSKYHFVAINYGGELHKKWVILMSVIDSSVVVKVSWNQLVDSSLWVPGWNDEKNVDPPKSINVAAVKTIDFTHPSIDSGLTIPITEDTIRPWFEKF